MNARLLFILLAITMILAFTRRYRQWGFSLSAMLVLLLVWFTLHQPQPATESGSGASSASTITAASAVQLKDPKLEGDGAPWHLSGSLLNVSATAVKTVEVQIERLDCPDPTAPASDCQVLWQGQHIVRRTLPAGSKATLDERFYSHESTARPTGMVRDQFTISAVR